MKQYQQLIAFFILCVGSLFAMESQDVPTSQNYEKEGWKTTLFDKQGWIEGGVKAIWTSSNMTPLYTTEIIQLGSNSNTITNVETYKSIARAPHPDYNLGMGAFFRYRAPTLIDFTGRYTYLRNNGNGKLKRTDTFQSVIDGDAADNTYIQDDKGHFHSHMHIADVFFGRLFPLVPQVTCHLSGGLTFNDFYLYYQQSDYDFIDSGVERNQGTNVQESIESETFYKEHHRFWGLGPKGELAFQFYFFPTRWNHSLMGVFNAEFALLYAKDWSKGKFNLWSTSTNIANQNTVDYDYVNWDRGAQFRLVPNINLDLGLKYQWESPSHGVIVSLEAGYRVWAYWQLEGLYDGRDQFLLSILAARSTRDVFFGLTQTNDESTDRLIYAGPYAGFSIAY